MKDSDRHLFKSLMANKDFRDWVNNPTENRNHYWEKWVKVNEDKREVVQGARNAVLKLRFKQETLEKDRFEEILTSIISDQDSHREKQKITGEQRNKGVKWWLMMAASFTFLSVFLFLILPWDLSGPLTGTPTVRTIQNPEGRKSKVKLPDGTSVNLNSASSLSFPSEFSDTLRWVELNGEAFFDVVENKDKPFVVKTEGLKTQVLGTTFNVNAYSDDDEIRIALLTGKVVIHPLIPEGNSTPQMLLPGEKFHFNKSTLSFKKTDFIPSNEIGWKDGVLVFTDTGFNEFVKILERWYGVEIIIDKEPSKPWNVNGHFRNESLEEMLIGVQFTHGISYQIDNKIVRISCD